MRRLSDGLQAGLVIAGVLVLWLGAWAFVRWLLEVLLSLLALVVPFAGNLVHLAR
jgi:hypothetical protein